MKQKNSIFIATSIDGYIADENGGIDWLQTFPNPENDDMGYEEFISGIDAVIMGRNTFETVINFNIPFPYTKPVFVLSNTLEKLPTELSSVFTINGNLNEIIEKIHKNGYDRLYIDGGKTIQSFLKEDLIDEMIITTIPILLGKGIPLFAELHKRLNFECLSTKLYLNKIVQNHFVRTK